MAQKRHVNYVLRPPVIDAAKPKDKPYSLTDGGGLFVEVMPGGSKVWRYKYHRAGKREKVTLGPYPALSIKDARDRHEELRSQLVRGDSPAKVKRETERAVRQAEANATTFQEFAERWVRETLFYRSESYRAQIVRWLDSYVFPVIGSRSLREVTKQDVLKILEDRSDTPVTADRIRVIIQQIYNFAARKLDDVTHNPARLLVGAIKVPTAEHHRHLNEKELAAFWQALDKQGAHATTIAATKLLFLTMARKSELLRSKWAEFDLDAAVWNVPAERMKMRRPHRVFLSVQAVANLREVHKLTGHGEYVFPSIFRGDVPMGDVTLNHLFRRMDFGVSDFSPHGTRGTAATLLREHGFGRDVVELLLAHAEKDKTAAAYSHIELAAERKAALQYLADHIDKLTTKEEAAEPQPT